MKTSRLLLQISDTHLAADPGHALRGVNTRDCLQTVLNAATEHLTEADQVIVTGDISHDESVESYSLIKNMLNIPPGQRSLLPGNHDNLEALRQVFPEAHWPTVRQLGEWRLIGLNSLLAAEEAGLLDDDQLKNLDLLLAENKSQPTVIALHHPPVPLESPWMDNISLINQQALRDLLSQHSQVSAVIFGHAHQELDVVQDGIRWLCCPSTCLQFLPQSDHAASDDRLPGYRWLRLFDDGVLETAVVRIESWPAGSRPDIKDRP